MRRRMYSPLIVGCLLILCSKLFEGDFSLEFIALNLLGGKVFTIFGLLILLVVSINDIKYKNNSAEE